MENFITTLAWIFGVSATILVILRLVAFAKYSDQDKFRDYIDGISRTFPLIKPIMIAIICWSWIFTQ